LIEDGCEANPDEIASEPKVINHKFHHLLMKAASDAVSGCGTKYVSALGSTLCDPS
jgi:hypothetical protein